jgi:hypothetical protein
MNNTTDNRDSSGQYTAEHASTVDARSQVEHDQERKRHREERRALMMTIARRDQPPLNATSTTDGLTLSHKPTTIYSNSMAEGDAGNNAGDAGNTADGDDESGEQKQGPGSVYSFRSSDLAQFVKNVHGR